VEGAVVLAVDAHQLVHARRVEHGHLVVEVRAANECGDLLVFNIASEDGLRGVLEGREDDRTGVDERPVEVEEHGLIAHQYVTASR
jgi:hypothetical protein